MLLRVQVFSKARSVGVKSKCEEADMMKCSMCSKKVKNGTGLAAHMRVHQNGSDNHSVEDSELRSIEKVLDAMRSMSDAARAYIAARIE
jgi:hypothetical protein